MEKENQKAEPVLGTEPAPPPTLAEIKRAAKRDLASCIAFLNAINTDEDMLTLLASFIEGRMLNHRHKQELKKQQELEV